jgi:2-(1,2-epoxy-1,2-dihydrophenyl)acetyl-CoA isomerase
MSVYSGVDGLGVVLDGVVLRLTLDRPEQRNALTDEITVALADLVERAGRDDAVRVIVLGGEGEHFCAGADLVRKNASGERPRVGSIQRRLPSTAHRLIPAILTVQTPVVCRVRGWAAGIGLHLAVAADFTVIADDARCWEPFSTRGFTPDSGGTWLLPRRIGTVRAREMLVLGRAVSGTEAAAWGLVHRAVPAAQLDAETEALVGQLASGPTVALGLTKWLLHAGEVAALDDHLRDEAFALELSSRSEDFREGLAAFRDRRDPEFRGR